MNSICINMMYPFQVRQIKEELESQIREEQRKGRDRERLNKILEREVKDTRSSYRMVVRAEHEQRLLNNKLQDDLRSLLARCEKAERLCAEKDQKIRELVSENAELTRFKKKTTSVDALLREVKVVKTKVVDGKINYKVSLRNRKIEDLVTPHQIQTAKEKIVDHFYNADEGIVENSVV